MGISKPKITLLMARLLASHVLMPAAHKSSEIYLRDNSDWWSFLGRPDTDEIVSRQEREPSSSHFEILGIKLNSEGLFDRAAAKLGKSVVINRADASAGRSQICYQSLKGSDNLHLIFERGEVTDSFYLFVGGPDWKGRDKCARSSLIAPEVSTASGVQLSQPLSRLTAILGKPHAVKGNTYTWAFAAQRKTPAKDLERLRNHHPELSDEDFHRNYDFFDLSEHIEARFSDAKLIYLGVSKSETY